MNLLQNNEETKREDKEITKDYLLDKINKIIVCEIDEFRHLSLQQLNNIYIAYKGIDTTVPGGKNEVMIDLQIQKEKELFETLTKFLLPDLSNITLCNVPSEHSEIVNMFLRGSMPENLHTFEFNKCSEISPNSSSENCLPHEYLNSLCIAIKSVQSSLRKFSISSFHMTEAEVERIMVVAENCEEICFDHCYLLGGKQYDFESIKSSNIKILDFDSCGEANIGNWRQYPKRFINLAIGISNSDHLRNSIKIVRIKNCGISEIFAENIMIEVGLGHVKLEI